jgi:hypothetical protein
MSGATTGARHESYAGNGRDAAGRTAAVAAVIRRLKECRSAASQDAPFFAERAALLRSYRPKNSLSRIAYFRRWAGVERAADWTRRYRCALGFCQRPCSRRAGPESTSTLRRGFCCRFAAGAATSDRPYNSWLWLVAAMGAVSVCIVVVPVAGWIPGKLPVPSILFPVRGK